MEYPLSLDEARAVWESDSSRGPPGAAGESNDIANILARGQVACQAGFLVEEPEDRVPPWVMGMKKLEVPHGS